MNGSRLIALSLLCWAALLIAQSAFSNENIRVEEAALLEAGVLDLQGATTLVIATRAKVNRAKDSQVLLQARKQLGFDGHPPRSMLVAQWRNYLGAMYCRDGQRMYLSTYGEWDSQIEGGATVELEIFVPKTLKIARSNHPPDQGPCSAKYSSPFTQDPPTESYWYTHSAPPPNWTRVEIDEVIT